MEMSPYDTRVSSMVRGKNGYAIVYYSIFLDAIEAEVEATLLWKGEPDTNHEVCVCGRLFARYRDFTYADDFLIKYYQKMFFNKPVDKELCMVPIPCASETCKRGEWLKVGKAIKLSRSKVAVRVSDSLVIIADLKTCEL